MERLRRECEERRHRLEEARNLHEYLREADDLEEFIADQMLVASSEDYGQDYEHLQVRIGLKVTQCIRFVSSDSME